MVNAWLTHLKKFYNANKDKMSYKEAKKTYKKEDTSKLEAKATSKNPIKVKDIKGLDSKITKYILDNISKEVIKDKDNKKWLKHGKLYSLKHLKEMMKHYKKGDSFEKSHEKVKK